VRGGWLLSEERQTYRVVVSSAAERDLKSQARKNRRDYGQVLAAIRALADDPRPPAPTSWEEGMI
jgi:mRNA-degrading endonuclease RelE of RelBE toxin-antitoxin system